MGRLESEGWGKHKFKLISGLECAPATLIASFGMPWWEFVGAGVRSTSITGRDWNYLESSSLGYIKSWACKETMRQIHTLISLL